jgi:hypothetical protein
MLALLTVSGGPAPSPFAPDFDPLRLPRVQAIASELRRWLDALDRKPWARFVSDGQPDIITIPFGTRGRVRQPPGTTLRVGEQSPGTDR